MYGMVKTQVPKFGFIIDLILLKLMAKYYFNLTIKPRFKILTSFKSFTEFIVTFLIAGIGSVLFWRFLQNLNQFRHNNNNQANLNEEFRIAANVIDNNENIRIKLVNSDDSKEDNKMITKEDENSSQDNSKYDSDNGRNEISEKDFVNKIETNCRREQKETEISSANQASIENNSDKTEIGKEGEEFAEEFFEFPKINQ
jgi:hypothetical protein